MRPFTSTLPFADAFKIMMGAAVPIARTETLGLVDADGRVIAADAIAAVDVPPFDRAAMDGYAVIAADTTGATPGAPAILTCAGRLFTGELSSRPVAPGTCVEIATGAPMPPGADAVVIVEDTRREGDAVRIHSAVRPGQNIGRRAADIAAGATTARAGQVLTPSRIGALAATGVAAIEVFARPSVAILSTGDEIVEPGEPLGAGRIYDVNRYTIETVVQRHGGVAAARPIAADSLEELIAALDEAAAHDIVVISGGSSVGNRDLVRDALAARGEIHFHGIAVKPGKPTAFATIGGTALFAMPGYPTSCLSNAYMLLVPFLRTVARLPPWHPRTIDAPLSRRITSAQGRLQFYTVRIADGRAEPAFKASGDITSMADADGYIEIPAEADAVEAGTMVTVKLF
jgi:molybdenum cofactor synthesis domain-containing protein